MKIILEEILNIFEDEEYSILKALQSNYGVRANKMFTNDYRTSNIPLLVALRRIRIIKKKIKKLQMMK